MTDQTKPASRPWRRFLRFSVRGMILLALVVGAGLGWVVRSAHTQRDAVAAIEREGGFVRYNWEHAVYDAGYGSLRIEQLHEKTWAPQWLIRLVGVDFFGHVELVSFYGRRPSASAALPAIGSLTMLKRLWLTSENIGDNELTNIKGLASLIELDLSNTHVTDAGLKHLKGLSSAAKLDFRGTQVTDAGVKDLQQALPRLKITR